jgi:Na+-transporting NADH:ubiquinone oxidoreductase subunit C
VSNSAKDSYDKDGIGNILVVAIAVCLVCSIIVAGTAVALKPAQLENKELDIRQNILRAAGLMGADAQSAEQVNALFEQFSVKLIELETGEYTQAIDPGNFDQLKSAKDPAMSSVLPDEDDPATLRRLEKYALVYLIESEQGIERVVLPIRGYGLWGTLYGYVAVANDFDTIEGLTFYAHKETPGLGGEVDNPNWKALWPGVKIYSEGQPAIALVKTPSSSAEQAAFEVDALSGASLTSRGVQNLMRFWLGDRGFGPYLKKLSGESGV